MKCGYCGKEIRNDAQFCSNCGHSIEELSEESNEPSKAEKGVYAASILALIIVLALVAYGGFTIIYRDLYRPAAVSASDEKSGRFNYDSTFTDPELVGKWKCTDRAAADYGEKNFGVEVSILLTLTDNAKFTLNYSMTDTGIQAKSLSTSGTYSTEDGMITFVPEQTQEMAAYLKRHGQRPSFQYATQEGSFTIKYENGKTIKFKKIDE